MAIQGDDLNCHLYLNDLSGAYDLDTVYLSHFWQRISDP